MNLVPVRETHLGYISVSQIVDESPYRFRRSDPDAVERLRLSFLRSGQSHPMLLEALSDGTYRVIDGHRRFDAVREIYRHGGFWHKVLAQVVIAPTPLAIFRSLYERNTGDHAYGLTELGRLFAWAQAAGVETRAASILTGLTFPEVEDLIELSEAPDALATLIDASRLGILYATMLFHRYRAWTAAHSGPLALDTVERILDQAHRSPLTAKGWRFLLDFYWSNDRPFMVSPARSEKC